MGRREQVLGKTVLRVYIGNVSLAAHPSKQDMAPGYPSLFWLRKRMPLSILKRKVVWIDDSETTLNTLQRDRIRIWINDGER